VEVLSCEIKKINQGRWSMFPSEVFKSRKDLVERSWSVKQLIMGRSVIQKWRTWHDLLGRKCRLGGVGLTCGFCQNLFVTYQSDNPQSRKKIESSFEVQARQCSQGNQPRDLSGSTQSAKFCNWKLDHGSLMCFKNMI
jgi:hypothetical protein